MGHPSGARASPLPRRVRPERRAPRCAGCLLPRAYAGIQTANSCMRIPRPTLPLLQLFSAADRRLQLGEREVERRRKLAGCGLWCSAQMVVAGGPGVVVARVRDEDTGPSCRLGQHLGGRRRCGPVAERRRRTSPVVERALGRPPAKERGGCVGVR